MGRLSMDATASDTPGIKSDDRMHFLSFLLAYRLHREPSMAGNGKNAFLPMRLNSLNNLPIWLFSYQPTEAACFERGERHGALFVTFRSKKGEFPRFPVASIVAGLVLPGLRTPRLTKNDLLRGWPNQRTGDRRRLWWWGLRTLRTGASVPDPHRLRLRVLRPGGALRVSRRVRGTKRSLCGRGRVRAGHRRLRRERHLYEHAGELHLRMQRGVSGGRPGVRVRPGLRGGRGRL